MTRPVIQALALMLMIVIPTGIGTAPIPTAEDNHKHQVLIPAELRMVTVTAYSSTSRETDSTPFVTASGKRVREGTVSLNFLPFNTEVTIPSVFGDKVFVVEDRMNKRFKNRIDVWMSDTQKAKEFGLRRAALIVLRKPALPHP